MPNQPHSRSEGAARRSHILTALLDRHRPALLRQASAHSHRPADAEDALQDACVQFLGHYDGPPGTDALRWMMLVTKRCAWAIGARQRRRECPVQLSATDASAEDEGAPLLVLAADLELDPGYLAERAERHAERAAALRALKPDERTAIGLVAAGYSYREIGEDKGWTHTKINRCLAEGRAALRAGDVDRLSA